MNTTAAMRAITPRLSPEPLSYLVFILLAFLGGKAKPMREQTGGQKSLEGTGRVGGRFFRSSQDKRAREKGLAGNNFRHRCAEISKRKLRRRYRAMRGK